LNPDAEWLGANQRFVVALLGLLRALLERQDAEQIAAARAKVADADAAMPAPTALARIAAAFQLSGFEQQLLMFCAAVEIDGEIARACAKAQNDAQSWLPTFALALSILPNGHWSAITPTSALRRSCLLDVLPGQGLSSSPLRIQERILHYLVGIDVPDAALAGILTRVEPPAEPNAVQRLLATQIVDECESADSPLDWPVVELLGPGATEKLTIAAIAMKSMGWALHQIDGTAPEANFDEDRWLHLVAREMQLANSVLVLDCDDFEVLEDAASRRMMAKRFAERYPGPLVVSASKSLQLARRPYLAFSVTSDVDRSGLDALHEWADPLVLPWDWDDLVVPEAIHQELLALVTQVQQREHLHESLGFAEASTLGVHVLFAGPSGTGKTMAATVIARELGMDLYRVDSSRIVSKYIGETEKNLRRLFTTAEENNCILLFDEAEALFGARSSVRDSHDRYANQEIAYLLQRMEMHRGVSILTTNMQHAVDPAMRRRLRFVVEFPFPTVVEREQIWRRVFPQATPVADIDFVGLARLNIAGGNIRNIAVAATSLASAQEQAVGMQHISIAVALEYKKLGRANPLAKRSFVFRTDAEERGRQ